MKSFSRREDGKKKKNDSTPVKSVSSDHTDDRRKRAELITARSKALKPLEQEIQRLEKTIADLEAAQGKDQQLLIVASQNNAVQEIQDLLKKTGEREKEIGLYYEKLSTLIDEYEKQKNRI